MDIIKTINDQSEYVPEPKSFKYFKEHTIETIKKVPKGQLVMAFDLLKQILWRMYGTSDYGILIEKVSTQIKETDRFSETMSNALKDAGWAKSTTKNIVCVLKKIMRTTNILPEFINKIQWIRVVHRSPEEMSLPPQVRHLDNDDELKQIVMEWRNVVMENTNNRSVVSLSGILGFYLRMTKNIKLDVFNPTDFSVQHLTGNEFSSYSQTQIRWTKLFFDKILNIKLADSIFPFIKRKQGSVITDDGSDKHRIGANDLDAIYSQVKDNVRDELMYLLMVTTGMRIGGLAKIKLDHVVTVTDRGVIARESGRTIEKGSKWFTFLINPRVGTLLEKWVSTLRSSNGSTYLFPGKGNGEYIREGSIRTIFHSWCKGAQIAGSHLHPHSLRHSYAHLLLEAGNDVHVVSKLLGHNNVTTTEMFYLKESSVDVAMRANIPWLASNKQEPTMPKFLMSNQTAKEISAKEAKKRKMKAMAKIVSFNDIK